MAFVLQQSPTFSHPITIRELLDGGKYRTHQFVAIYRRLPQSRMEEVQLQYQAIKSAAVRDEPLESIPTREIAAEILHSWEGITNIDGSPVEFSEAYKSELLEVATVADVLVETFFDAHAKAKAKN
jgi:hypothetical protein